MGQIFHACAYDIETRTCCTIYADKFHANCYSYSSTVVSMHYLLRQKPYHIMWGGDYIVIDDALSEFSRTEDLLGISTYENYESFEMNNKDLLEKSYYDKVKFIDDNSKLWKRMDVECNAAEYFDYPNKHSVEYSGYLINHTQKLAIDLKDYFVQSQYITQNGINAAIDAIPVLTDTGGGTIMALFGGVAAQSTESLSGGWCGDLLQIVDNLPKDYKKIECCIVTFSNRAEYCYLTFGVNKDNYLLSDRDGNLFEGAAINVFGKRGPLSYVQVEVDETNIIFNPVYT